MKRAESFHRHMDLDKRLVSGEPLNVFMTSQFNWLLVFIIIGPLLLPSRVRFSGKFFILNVSSADRGLGSP